MMLSSLLEFMERVKKKEAQYAAHGYGGKGLEKIEAKRNKTLQVQKSVSIYCIMEFLVIWRGRSLR